MLLGSDFILNQVSEKKSIEIAPFVHCTNNNLNDKMRLKTVMIPDSLACEEISPDSDFSMTSGDFLEVYGNQNAVWDSVVTCFFIDTANNVLNYIDLIHKLLRVGGVWLNYGPLLYHYHDQPAQVSIELSWQALRKYIAVKFEIVSETIEEATYCHMPDSMSISKYQCVYFTAKKR
jgi:carnosine N-methyltransferase